MKRRSYNIEPKIINGLIITEVIIDPHVDKHRDHIDDNLILKLVDVISSSNTQLSDYKDKYSYFVSLVVLNNSSYKIVWLIEDSKFYIGIITAFKDRRL